MPEQRYRSFRPTNWAARFRFIARHRRRWLPGLPGFSA